jgi:hypothetical protein
LKTIKDIKNRFIDEIHQTDSYIYYMHDNFYLRFKDVRFIDGIEKLEKLIKNYSFTNNSRNKTLSNYRLLKKLVKELYELYTKYLLEFNLKQKISVPRMSAKVKKLLEEGNLEGIIEPMYNVNQHKTYYDFLKAQNANEVKADIDCDYNSRKYYSEYTVANYIIALNILAAKEYNKEIDELEYNVQWLEDFRIHFKLYDVKNPINIYRQSFILIMAAFDAAVFDLVKELFKDNFFQAMPLLNAKGKIDISSLNEYRNFSEMKEREIENNLGKIYISEVLGVLYKYNKSLFIIDGIDIYNDILEMVSRRNIHLHNKGIIDQKYFEKGNGSQKYKLKKGQYAEIDSSYYFDISNKLEEFIKKI